MNEISQIVFLTLKICAFSTFISTFISIGLAFLLGLRHNRLINIIKMLINALTSLPPVIAGVIVYLLFSRNGIFGKLSWIYTPKVIIIAQVIIVIPIICANIYPAVESISKSFLLTSRALGLRGFKFLIQLIKEVEYSVISAIISGFGRSISEVGAVMIVGGNVRFKTRVLTSAIVLENNKGNYEMSLKLGLILMIISLIVSFTAMFFRESANAKNQ
ncbi:MAG: ABC transporter permease [Tissierellia bacterium]|nr:ABC transporter permease [Tissierellia bacterium]